MGALNPTIKVYAADGTTLVETVATWTGAKWSLGARLGCRGGEFSAPGDARLDFAYEQDQFVKVFYETGEAIYAGRIDGPKRTIEGGEHHYTLRSPWADLERVDMSTKVTLGSESEVASTGTIAQIIEYLFTNRIDGDTVFTLGTHACPVPVALLTLEPGTDLGKLFEQLELMASSDGQTWCSGIAPDLSIYFIPIPAATDETPIPYTVGDNVFTGDQLLRGRYVGNHLALVGGVGETSGGSVRHYKLLFDASTGGDWATSATEWGLRRIRTIHSPSMRSEADMVRFSNGWLARYGRPLIKLDNMSTAYSGDMEAGQRPVFPWEARGVYTDTQRGELAPADIIAVMDFVLADGGFTSTATIGLQEEPGSEFSPSRERDVYEDSSTTIHDWALEIPVATDTTAPPGDSYLEYPDAPGGGGPVENAGPEAVGLTIIEILPGSGWRAGDSIPVSVKISPGTYVEGDMYVLVHFAQYDQVLAAVDDSAIECTLDYTDTTGYQIWKTNAAFTTTETDGYLYIGVTVTADTALTDEEIVYHPCNMVTDPLDGAQMRLHIGEGDTTLTTLTIYLGGFSDGG
jgi:hypothetical protein